MRATGVRLSLLLAACSTVAPSGDAGTEKPATIAECYPTACDYCVRYRLTGATVPYAPWGGEWCVELGDGGATVDCTECGP